MTPKPGRILVALALAGALTLAGASWLEPPRADAAGVKNLKILPRGTSSSEVKRLMRTFNKALGVKCGHCHDMSDMSVDTPKKETARQMMRMVQTINGKYLPRARNQVDCATCHGGRKTPSK
jgi:collagenase-like PrtC family protease